MKHSSWQSRSLYDNTMATLSSVFNQWVSEQVKEVCVIVPRYRLCKAATAGAGVALNAHWLLLIKDRDQNVLYIHSQNIMSRVVIPSALRARRDGIIKESWGKDVFVHLSGVRFCTACTHRVGADQRRRRGHWQQFAPNKGRRDQLWGLSVQTRNITLVKAQRWDWLSEDIDISSKTIAVIWPLKKWSISLKLGCYWTLAQPRNQSPVRHWSKEDLEQYSWAHTAWCKSDILGKPQVSVIQLFACETPYFRGSPLFYLWHATLESRERSQIGIETWKSVRLKLVNMGRDIHEDGRGEDEEDVGEDTELLSTASLEGLDFDRWN